MAVTNWITITEVKANAIPRTSFDTAPLTPNIPIAQEIYIRPFLGEDFYDEINDEVIAASISADNTALLDGYLKKALAYFVVYVSYYDLNFKETTKGTRQELSDFSQPVDGSKLELKRSDILTKAQHWLNIAQRYIKDQQEVAPTKFPNYSVGVSDAAQSTFNQEYIPD